MLVDVQLDTVTALLNFITSGLSMKKGRTANRGKTAYNVVNALHSMMDYAWRSRRISQVPPFPRREDYGISTPVIRWLSEDRQMAVINAIPVEHRPVFLWLKYHLRRPSEACALRWEDYDAINRVWVIRRSVSARQLVESTKTGAEHLVPCHPDFYPILESLTIHLGRHVFINPRARKDGGRYTGESLNRIWHKACAGVGESIDLYSGTKHSSCSQYVNERGLTIHDVKELTDHKRLDSVRRYAAVSMARKRELMARSRVIPFPGFSRVADDKD
jgi:integrase